MIVCKSCDKLIRLETNMEDNDYYYHKACYKSRMDTTTYEDPKMDAENYPVSHNAPMREETREEQYGHLYKALGTVAATNWIVENTGEDINMEDIFHKIINGEIDYAK